MATLEAAVALEMVQLVAAVGEAISFLGVETGDGDLVVLVVVMLVGVEMTVAHKIGTTVWMGVGEGDVDGDDLITESIFLIGAEAEAIAVALKEFEHGILAEAEAEAEAAAGVVEAEAGPGVVVVVGAGHVAAVTAAAVAGVVVVTVVEAPVMRDMRGLHVFRNLMSKFLNLWLHLNQGCLLCPQAQKSMHPQTRSLWGSCQWLRRLS